MEPQPSSSPKATPGCSEVGQSESLPTCLHEVVKAKQLNEALEKMKSEIISQIKTMLSDAIADMDKKINELKKIMEVQHMKEMESIKQAQADIQENKNSTKTIPSRLGQCEDRISDIKNRLAVSDQENRFLTNSNRP